MLCFDFTEFPSIKPTDSMNPQYQTRKDRKERNGDCVRACIATLLEVDISKVPDFVLAPEIEGSLYPAWWLALQSWLAEMGLWFLEMHLPPNMPFMPLPLAALCIFFGETSTGVKHAIIGRIEHDQLIPVFNPWPEAEFTNGVVALGFIIPRDPSLPVHFGRALDRIANQAKHIYGPVAAAILEDANNALGRQGEGLQILPS